MKGKLSIPDSMRVHEWQHSARMRLDSAFSSDDAPDPSEARAENALTIQLLLGFVLDRPRAWLLAHPENAIASEEIARLETLLQQVLSGVPLPYLLGHWEFFGLDFVVNPAVLIPRPETELLVERAIEWLRGNPNRRRAADVGTGSGCIAASIARHVSDARILAVDRSRRALQTAVMNFDRLGVSEAVRPIQGNLLTAAAGPLDLVCANLPYIQDETLADLAVARYEPRSALSGGTDGLAFIRSLLEDAPRWLAEGGLLLLEMQYDQSEPILNFAKKCLPKKKMDVRADLSGLPRLVMIE